LQIPTESRRLFEIVLCIVYGDRVYSKYNTYSDYGTRNEHAARMNVGEIPAVFYIILLASVFKDLILKGLA